MSAAIDWQKPNKTEGFAWARMACGSFAEGGAYLPFPWASWIDARHRGLEPTQHPPQQALQGLKVTVCQHIWALDHLQAFMAAGITDLFWSHAPRSLHHASGLRLHPFPLFPVRCHDHPPPSPLQPSPQRPLLYCYQGFHQRELYPKATREWLLQLPSRQDCRIASRQEWHFEQQVYRQQVHGLPPDPQRLHALQQEAADYALSLQSSRFALCPSGAGPNSIRLWEALGYGAIPVILSDDLRLPGEASLWHQAAVVVAEQEQAVAALPESLMAISQDADALLRMQRAGQQLWALYGLPAFVTDVQQFLSDPDAFLLEQSRIRLQQRLTRTEHPPGSAPPAELLQDDPSQLVLQVRRWMRSAGRPSHLVLQLLDNRPLPEQWIRWRVAVSLCRRLLAEEPAVSWTLCSRHPALEELAEAPGA